MHSQLPRFLVLIASAFKRLRSRTELEDWAEVPEMVILWYAARILLTYVTRSSTTEADDRQSVGL